MGKLFGTDGIRGIAFQDPITEETAQKLGSAVVRFNETRGRKATVVIGRDTRESGPMLEKAVASGVARVGGEISLAGQLPTPAIALLTRQNDAGAGIVISASHNPHEYNGFKLFTNEGYKFSEKQENEIEELMGASPDSGHQGHRGKQKILDRADLQYESFLRETLKDKSFLRRMKIVLDCANGATWRISPRILKGMVAEVEALAVHPSGRNINLGCGSEHTDPLSRRVSETGADVGLAFDGDGDRIIAVDEKGVVMTGDQIIAVCAKMLKGKEKLQNNLVVSTIMSNMGLGLALKNIGVELITTKVGDRHVMEEMRARKAVLGGENSGHIIFSDHHTTGDGILSALQLLMALAESGQRLSELSGFMKVFPQALINVPVAEKPDIQSVRGIWEVLKDIEKRLGDRGRVLVRYSGTEPLCRVMVEGEKEEETSRFAALIASAVEKEIGIR